MKHTKMTALLCTLALSGYISATAAPQAGSTPLDPYRAAVQKMKDLEKAEKKGEQSAPAPASAPAAAASAGDVNYTDALLKGLDLTGRRTRTGNGTRTDFPAGKKIYHQPGRNSQ